MASNKVILWGTYYPDLGQRLRKNLMMTGGYGNEETMAGHAGRGLHADWEHGDDGDGGE